MSFRDAASSASDARLSKYVCLSARILLRVALWACPYSSWALAFSALVRLLFTAAFFPFRPCNDWMDSGEIQSLWLCLLGPSTSLHASENVSLRAAHLTSIPGS